MSLSPVIHRNQKGFSLIEVILVIILSSVAFAMMAGYFRTTMTDSALPIHRLSHAMALKQIAERITEAYNQDPTADLNVLKNSLAATPAVYGQNYTVVINAFIKFVSQGDVLALSGDPEDLLKVQIQQNDTNETLTLLFARE
jgi:prepilin-type N-terminal cleavage/methylation domain-containing protein